MKDNNHFKLSSSFQSLFNLKSNKVDKPLSADKALYRLNPSSANALEDVPVDVLRRKSKSKLESLKDEANTKKFSIFQQKV